MRMHRPRQTHWYRSRPMQTVLIGLLLASFVILALFHPACTAASSAWNVRGSVQQQQQNNAQLLPFDSNGIAQAARHLIIVAGHSVTVSGHLFDADHDEHDWYLLDYQRGHGLPEAVVGHITAGIEAAAAETDSLLVFSGGATRPTTGPDTEGASYFRVADAMGLWKGTVRARATSEDFARDSFENLYVVWMRDAVLVVCSLSCCTFFPSHFVLLPPDCFPYAGFTK